MCVWYAYALSNMRVVQWACYYKARGPLVALLAVTRLGIIEWLSMSMYV